MTRTILATLLGLCLATTGCKTAPQAEGWICLFDGKTLDGWTVNENKETFSVVDGTIKVKGERGHLFYTGPVENGSFTNFEWKADVLTKPNANSGMYFHTAFQPEGWPAKGYEVQVNNSHTDWRRTGGLYAVSDVKEAPAKDDEWFTQHIIVQGNRIIIKVNGKVTVDYTEPAEVMEKGQPGQPGRKVSGGTFALQGHDPGSEVYYKNILVKPLP